MDSKSLYSFLLPALTLGVWALALLAPPPAASKDIQRRLSDLHCSRFVARDVTSDVWLLEFDESPLRFFLEAGRSEEFALATKACASRQALHVEYDAATRKIILLKVDD